MKDPHIHVEKFLFCTNAQMRECISDAIGLACDMPKTTGTGCGKRRPYVMTSTVPAHVTCLACREYAASFHHQQAADADMLAAIDPADAIWTTTKLTPATLTATAAGHRALAGAFTVLP